MLAQITPAQWSGFTVVLTALIAVAANIAIVWGLFKRSDRRREIHPQPLEIKEATQFASKKDLDQLAAARQADMKELEISARARSSATYDKIDEIRIELTQANDATRAEMQKGFKDMERALGRLEGKIDRSS